jgi:hypothetical protein
VIVLVFGFGTLVLVIAACLLLARKLWREVALEDADAVLRSEYEAFTHESDRGKKSCTRR